MDSQMNAPNASLEFAAVHAVASACPTTRTELLFVSRKWSPSVGGMETYSLKLSKELEKYACVERKVLPGTPDGGSPGFGALLRFGVEAAASIAVRKRPAGIVHVADMASWPLVVVARLRSRRTKVVLSAHGTDIAFPDRNGVLPFLYGLYMHLGGYLARNCRVLANSRATEIKVWAFGFRSTEVIPLATDLKSALDLRSRGEGEKSVLFAGRLVARKGCRWFIENVLPDLPENVRLDVAGTIWDEKEKDALTSSRVRYLGALGWEDLRLAYANADCVVVPNIPSGPSDFEGFGLVAVEAAAAGGVVLAAAHTGLEDAVLHGVTGMKLPAGDAPAWAAAVRDVLDWPDDRRQAFLERSVEAAQRHYSWERVGRSTFMAYGHTS